MLTVVVLLPVLVAGALLVLPVSDRAALRAWVGAAAVDLALVVWMWVNFDPGTGARGIVDGIAYETNVQWIPTVDASYHVGVDGLSLPLIALTAVLFLATAVWSLREDRRPRRYAALFLFLQTASLGTFAALDLILFFVFFDLSIVGMYFVIAGWGHGNNRRSALKFFLYTFVGSLALLVGFIGLFLGGEERTFDMVRLAANPPLEDSPLLGGLVLLAIGLGLAVKTPLFPFHTWLPDAHTDAPAAGSAILAGVLLKLGTYGFVRIAMPMLPGAWQRWAMVAVVIGVISVLWGAFVALAQRDAKRMIAYTSVNHMGYVILGLGAAGLVAADEQARTIATVGALVQMVSHGLLTGALFLLAGVLWTRGRTYDFSRWGGLARPAPLFAAAFAVAAFGSLGLPGFSSFIAEFQIFTGTLRAAPVAGVIAVTGILVTAGLFLLAVQRLLTGPTLLNAPESGQAGGDGEDEFGVDEAGVPAAIGAVGHAGHTAGGHRHPDGPRLSGGRDDSSTSGHDGAHQTHGGGAAHHDGHPAEHRGHDGHPSGDSTAGAMDHPTGPSPHGGHTEDHNTHTAPVETADDRPRPDRDQDLTASDAGPATDPVDQDLPVGPSGPGGGPPRPADFPDLFGREGAAILPLLVLSVAVGLLPRFLLDVVEPAAAALVSLVSR
ncbi:NADH-quinone oxidoreductase subunit M [Georgenia muralis]|uniref:NADH-quinone oxidoreductase subunit M n=1 Tax=Georgenia muralis TaxID=154117 RepID=A0A3N4Z8P6_9MICO|nr:NADH-quinone oxidoreductase subunit M [Georgenia muralis]RPF28276.1 NADH-quinone oxidoreductase subunit M [Georgenia muralis]